jgi:hypothetical protein
MAGEVKAFGWVWVMGRFVIPMDRR